MRVALCYSGLTRNFWDCIESHRIHIFNKLNPDIFIHTWSKIGSNKSPHWYTDRYNFEEHTKEIIAQENLNVDFIIREYKPKKIVVEYPNIEYFYNTFFCQENPNFFNNVMMHYGINYANSLKTDYEKINNFKYDLVIRCRFDLFFENIIFEGTFIDGLKNGTIYLAPNENMDRPFTEHMKKILNDVGTKYMPNDQFAYGNSEAMDYYSSVYMVYKTNFNTYIKHPEGVLSEHLWSKNLSIFKDIQVNDSIRMRLQSRYW